MSETDQELMTPEEVAKVLRVSARLVRSWRGSGKGPRGLVFVMVGGRVRVKATSLRAVLDGEGDTHGQDPSSAGAAQR